MVRFLWPPFNALNGKHIKGIWFVSTNKYSMSVISSVANYGGRQPTNTSFIKQFVQSATSVVEWIFVTTGGITLIEPSITNKNIYIPQSMIIEGDLTVNGVFNNPSDVRLKKGINNLGGDLLCYKLSQLRPVSYFFKHDEDETHKRYGLIAQEVEKIFPELVSKPTTEEEMKAVNYIELVPLLLAQIQNMEMRINGLEQTIEMLERKHST